MSHMVRQTARYLKNAWDQEPIVVVSFAFGITGKINNKILFEEKATLIENTVFRSLGRV